MEQSMFVKATITTIIAALLAGGVVYYGMPNGNGGGANVSQEPSETIQKQWMNKYLKPDSETDAASDTSQTEPDNSAPEPAMSMPESEPEIDETEPGTLSENDPVAEITVSVEDTPSVTVPRIAPDVRARLKVAQDQIGLIDQTPLKDQAILSVVDFAVSEGLYSEAEQAVSDISQADLRDSARSRIANGYAKIGHAEDAFRLIDDIEVEALRDAMRVRAIKALIGTENLTKTMQ